MNGGVRLCFLGFWEDSCRCFTDSADLMDLADLKEFEEFEGLEI